MRFSGILRSTLVAICLGLAHAQSSWSYEDASVAIQGKGAGVGGASSKEQFSRNSPLTSPVTLGPSDTLKVVLTTKEDDTPKRPHQAFLTLKEPATGLEESYVFTVKDNGKGKVEVTQKDLPFQFLTSSSPLKASLTIGSFGSSTAMKSSAFDVIVKRDESATISTPEKPTRYGKLPEIHHMFRADPKSPPKIITLVFTAAALTTLPALFIGWMTLGANFNHLSDALGTSPVSHAVFFGSLVAMEGIFFMYYTTWNLFQTLPALAAVGLVAVVSGSRALTEVQSRRLAGKR